MSDDRKMTQEEVITLKLAKNIELIDGKMKTIGSTSKVLGGMTDEQYKQVRTFGIEIAKKVGIEENKDIVMETFGDEDFRKELGLESEFCNEYWMVRREYEIAKYFSGVKDIMEDLLQIMSEELSKGIKDSFKKTKTYKMNKTADELKEYIKDYETIKKELEL